MKGSVYEWGTNKFFEHRLIKVLRDISEIKEDKRGWMLTHTNGEKDYLLKSQYKVVTNN
jgi:hypothetical protein